MLYIIFLSQVLQKQGAGAVVDKTKQTINKLPPGAKGGLAVAGTAAALIGAKDIIDGAKDLAGGGNDKEKPEEKKKGPTLSEPYSTVTKTTPVAGPKGRAWWQTYEKAAPYHSSKKYYNDLRDKYK